MVIKNTTKTQNIQVSFNVLAEGNNWMSPTSYGDQL